MSMPTRTLIPWCATQYPRHSLQRVRSSNSSVSGIPASRVARRQADRLASSTDLKTSFRGVRNLPVPRNETDHASLSV